LRFAVAPGISRQRIALEELMRLVKIWVSALLLCVPAIVAAEPVSDAVFDRFMAVLPDRDRLEKPDLTPLPSDVAALLAVNPGREKDIRSVLSQQIACNAGTTRDVVRETMRVTLDQLGPDKAALITAFYAGTGEAKRDTARLDTLNAELAKPGTDIKAAEDEMMAIMNRYSLIEFANIMQQEGMRVAGDWKHIQARKTCWEAHDQTMAKAGLKAK